MALLLIGTAAPARAEQSVRDVLAFLLTNRSIATGDFVRDEQAAAATSDTIAQLLLSELGTVPVTSSASGFTYRLDPALGVSVRSSDSFGPVFVERSLTAGRGRASFAVGHQTTTFRNIDGRPLLDGTLVSTASRLRGDPAPFDVETVTLQIETRSTLVSANIGLTDRFDLGAVVTFLRVAIDGQRIDTYRGTPFLQATGVAIASGLGDVIARGKYNVVRQGGSGVAVAVEARFPTGDADNLLGSDRTTLTPRFIASYERGRVAVHGDTGFAAGGFSNEWQYRGAATVVAHPRVTVVGELLGRRPLASVQLSETIDPHPDLINVDTIRLTGVSRGANRLSIVGAARWNVASSWLLTVTLLKPVTSGGLNAAWVPIVALDYSFGR
jgi:hypothetical protein